MADNTAGAYEVLQDNGTTLILGLSGSLNRDAHKRMRPEIDALMAKAKFSNLSLDLSRVSLLDDSGALLLAHFFRKAKAKKAACSTTGAPGNIQEVLDMLHFETLVTAPPLVKAKRSNPVTALGEAVINGLQGVREMIVFTGSLALCALYVLKKPHTFRFDDMIFQMRAVGVDAVPIVALISALLGFIFAYMSSVQLSQFGASIFIATLVALVMVREMGPVMTAILVSGRSGSSFASEIGTMKISEEVDALTTMGFDPVAFIVLPKLVASVLVMPILSLFACFFGIFGGLVVGLFFLGLTFDAYMTETFKMLKLADVIWVFVKGVTFAVLVSWIGCFRGFQVRGGASSVGKATTSAVVSGIFLVIFWDAIFAFVRLYWK